MRTALWSRFIRRATLDIPENDDRVVFGDNASPTEAWPFHILFSVLLRARELEAIGTCEGWRVKTCGRRMRRHEPFIDVIESGSRTG